MLQGFGLTRLAGCSKGLIALCGSVWGVRPLRRITSPQIVKLLFWTGVVMLRVFGGLRLYDPSLRLAFRCRGVRHRSSADICCF